MQTSLAQIAPFLIVIGMAGMAGTIAFFVVAAERKRKRALFDRLRAHGFAVVEKVPKEDREAAFAPFAAIAFLRHGAKGVRWSAGGRVQGRDVRLVEHAYIIHTGKSSTAIVNVCVAAVGGSSWPLLTLTAESVLDRLGEKLGLGADVKLEDGAFNNRWRIRCDDEGFALAVLGPEVQKAIGGGPSGVGTREWWCFGGPDGLVCIGRRGRVDAAAVAAMLGRLGDVLAAMPEEARAGLGL